MLLLESHDDAELRSEIIHQLLECGEAEVKVLEYITGIPPTMPEAPQLAQYTRSHEPWTIDRSCPGIDSKGENIEAVTVWKELIQHDKENLLCGKV